ncbi:MAG TPA: FHA domain-containing serine/threonine-protein kinase [Gemmata sp.]
MTAAVILRVVEGDLDRSAYVFVDPVEVTLGRGAGAGIRIPEAERYNHVSRTHCRLVIAPPSVTAFDAGGRHGTHVNGVQIPAGSAGRPLVDGDELRLGALNPGGGVVFRVSCTGAVACGGCGQLLDRAGVLGGRVTPAGLVCAGCTTPPSGGADPAAPATCPGCRAPGPGVCKACREDPLKLAEQVVANEPALAGWSLGRRLGKGGAGAVYLLSSRRPGAPVALKLVLAATTPYERAICEREVRYTAQLAHPNLIRFGAPGCWNGVVYFTMDYCPGGSLFERLKSRGRPLGQREAVRIAVQVLDALVYLHQLPVSDPPPPGAPGPAVGLVHRDIKPGNVLLSDESTGARVRVSDLGLAKAFQYAGHSGVTAPTQDPIGTPPFMSRWQLDRFKWAGPEVDVWATAATLYFALSGRSPRTFGSGTAAEVIRDTAPVPISRRLGDLRRLLGARELPELPERLMQLIDEALRDDRPHTFTAAGLRAELLPFG